MSNHSIGSIVNVALEDKTVFNKLLCHINITKGNSETEASVKELLSIYLSNKDMAEGVDLRFMYLTGHKTEELIEKIINDLQSEDDLEEEVL